MTVVFILFISLKLRLSHCINFVSVRAVLNVCVLFDLMV